MGKFWPRGTANRTLLEPDDSRFRIADSVPLREVLGLDAKYDFPLQGAIYLKPFFL